MQQEMSHHKFFNALIGNRVEQFWLTNQLKMSPTQYVKFFYKLARWRLDFDSSVQQNVKKMLFVETIAKAKLYAKSEWALDIEPQFGEYIDRVDKGWICYSGCTKFKNSEWCRYNIM